MTVRNLSGYTRFITDLEQRWQSFQEQRAEYMLQQARYGSAPEKIAEDILKGFFSLALDWPLGNINNQLGYADMVLTHQGIKKLVVEVKRPGSLSWEKQSLSRALEQAYRYAQEQRVTTIAVSDGDLFFAADIRNGGLVERLRLCLTTDTSTPNLYWVSVDGIHRPTEQLVAITEVDTAPTRMQAKQEGTTAIGDTELLHPKHRVPARCFGYVGNPLKPATWKLPCRLIDGSPDEKHLPGAIRAVLTNYRGAYNKTIPEEAIPDVLVRLGKAAWEAKKMPGQASKPLVSYQLLYDALYQKDRLEEIKSAINL